MSNKAAPVLELDQLVARARRLAAADRAVVGICGAPGSGKSTVAQRLAAAVGPGAVVVPMDGFHLTDTELRRLGRADRKGAPDTFDVAGYVALLHRLRAEADSMVYAPEFDRTVEQSLAGAIAVRPEHRLVLTEGNYLLLDSPGWAGVRPLLDEVWFVVSEETTRVGRLVERHVRHGRTQDAAQRWVARSDEANAELVAQTQWRADVLTRND